METDLGRSGLQRRKELTMDASGHLVPTSIPAAPDIDFSREMIIVAAMGPRPTSGYAIIVEEAYERSDRFEVVVRSISPGSCGQFQMETQPVEIVRIVKSEHPIVFREIKGVQERSTFHDSGGALSPERRSLIIEY